MFTGYRAWDIVVNQRGQFQLMSPYVYGPGALAWGRENRATYQGRERAKLIPADVVEQEMAAGRLPEAGIHALKELSGLAETLASFEPMHVRVLGTVVLYGTVVEHEIGYRASRARVDGIFDGIYASGYQVWKDWRRQAGLPTGMMAKLLFKNFREPQLYEYPIDPLFLKSISRPWFRGQKVERRYDSAEVLQGLSEFYDVPLIQIPRSLSDRLA